MKEIRGSKKKLFRVVLFYTFLRCKDFTILLCYLLSCLISEVLILLFLGGWVGRLTARVTK